MTEGSLKKSRKNPARIQLKRTKGFNLQSVSANLNGLPAVFVSRPARYGNPFKIGLLGVYSNEDAVNKFQRMIDRQDINDDHRWFIYSKDRIMHDLKG